MAVDAICRRSRTIDTDFEKQPRPGSLLAMAGRVDEIPSSLFAAGRHWKPSPMVTRLGRNESRLVLCDGGGQPALFAAGDDGDFPGHSLNSFPECDPSASGAACGRVALRIPGGPLRVVPALAGDFRGHTGCGATTGRTRGGGATPTGAYWGDAQAY